MGLFRRAADAALDRSVLFAFDRAGYRRHARRYAALPRIPGRRCLITGANAGLGEAAADALAGLGAHVTLLCRSLERGRAAADRMLARHPGADVSLVQLDVSALASVRSLPARLPPGPIDVLVHNAGVLPPARETSADGFELTWATNVLGPFALTRALWPRLSGGRVIWVSSGGGLTQRLQLDDLDWRARPFDGVRAYAMSKRAEIVLARLFAERHPTGPWQASMHPGWADTAGVRDALPRFHRRLAGRLRTAAEGADTMVWLSAAPVPGPSGGLWFDRAPAAPHPLPGTREAPQTRDALWRRLETQLG